MKLKWKLMLNFILIGKILKEKGPKTLFLIPPFKSLLGPN